MNFIPIRFSEIFPYVRYVQRFFVSDNAYPSFFQAYDNRIFYIAGGSGTALFKNRTCRLNQGDVIIWPAGTEYKMRSAKNDTLILLGANFDFTQRSSQISYPVPPVTTEAFNPERLLDRTVFTDSSPLQDIIHLTNMFQLEAEFLEMLTEYDAQKIYYNERLSSILKSVLCLICRKATLQQPGIDSDTDSAARLDQVIAYIHTHYTEPLSNQTLGEKFNYHPNYLNKLIKIYTGQSLHQYLISCRISKAIDFLSTTNLSVSEIAERVGFNDLCHFGKTFHSKVGVAPSSLRDPRTHFPSP